MSKGFFFLSHGVARAIHRMLGFLWYLGQHSRVYGDIYEVVAREGETRFVGVDPHNASCSIHGHADM